MSTQKAVEETRLRPCLRELFRTCIHPDYIILRIEHLAKESKYEARQAPAAKDSDPVLTSPRRNQWLRLFLSDGELQVQAVLQRHLVSKHGLESLKKGDLIRIRKFEVKKARRTNGSGSIVYLGILDFDVLVQRTNVAFDTEGGILRESAFDESIETADAAPVKTGSYDLLNEGTMKRALVATDDAKAQGTLKEGDTMPGKKRVRIVEDSTDIPSYHRNVTMPDSPEPVHSPDTDEDAYETMSVNPAAVEKRRRILRRLEENMEVITAEGIREHPGSLPRQLEDPKALRKLSHFDPMATKAWPPTIEISKINSDMVETSEIIDGHLSLSEKLSQTPLRPFNRAPVHTLGSLLDHSNNLPKRNYICTVFAVVSWTSPSLIDRRNGPFPPKRHIKLHDPTIAARHAGVSLAVFIDAKVFRPKAGTVALFRGLTMQKWEGEVILNAYESLQRAAEPWFVDDASELMKMGFDVEDLTKWWKSRTA